MRTTVLMTVEGKSKAPTLAEAADALGLPDGALDPEFGVVAIDPEKGLFTVRVFADQMPERPDKDRPGASGPFSDPRIEPFGIPRR